VKTWAGSGFDDITPAQRNEVRRIITEQLVDDAQREFPADMAGQSSALAPLQELAIKIPDGADRDGRQSHG
jgi:hypothetical protein